MKRSSLKRPLQKPTNSFLKIVQFLHTMKTIEPSNRSAVIQGLDNKSCKLLYRAITSALQSPYVGPTRRKRLSQRLAPYKNQLRILMMNNTDLRKKKKILKEMGGFPLDIILNTAIPLLLSLTK